MRPAYDMWQLCTMLAPLMPWEEHQIGMLEIHQTFGWLEITGQLLAAAKLKWAHELYLWWFALAISSCLQAEVELLTLSK